MTCLMLSLNMHTWLKKRTLPPIKVQVYSKIGFVNIESILYSGVQLKVSAGILKKFLIKMKKEIGNNHYIKRLQEFVNNNLL